MFSGITTFIQTNMMIIIGLLIVSFLGYFGYSQWRISSLVETNSKNDITIEAQTKNIDQLKSDAANIKRITHQLNELNRKSINSENDLRRRLNGLGQLARDNPTEIEDRINEATNLRIRCMELATGAEILEGETNTECPHFLE